MKKGAPAPFFVRGILHLTEFQKFLVSLKSPARSS
jgi:hypothetical protein